MRVTIDLMKKSTQIIDLSNVINPRVGDDDLQLPLHIGYGDNLFDMRGKDVEFLSNDPNKKNIYIAGTCNTNTPGDNLYMGDLTFRFPAGTFKADGTYDPDKTMFRIVDKETKKVISSVNVKITVMKNNIEFDFDPDKSSYDSRAETMLNDFKDKGQAMLDEIKDLNNQAKSNVSGDTATTATEAKKQANTNASDISDLKGEVAGARGRFTDMAGREDAQDIAINQKESIANANANYAELKRKNAQQDSEIVQKAGKLELEGKLAQMNSQPEAFENEEAIKAKYPNGKAGIMVAIDTGHKWIWFNNVWNDCGIYQAAGDTSYNNDKFIANNDDLRPPYDDLNSLPINSTVTYVAGLEIKNIPSAMGNGNFTIHTYGTKQGGQIGATQLLFTDSQDNYSCYYRTAWGSPAVWSEWQISKDTKIFTEKKGIVAPYNSLDTLPAGSIVSYEPGLLDDDLPYTAASQGYTVITSGNGFAGKVQDVILSNGTRYHRISWGSPATWSEWQATSASYVFVSKDDIKNPFDNLDTLPGNSTVTYVTGLLAADFPFADDSQGYTITTNGNGFAGKVQTVTCTNKNRYYRLQWGSPAKWGDWQPVNSNHIFVSRDQLTAPYDNLDLLPSGSLVTYVSGLPNKELPFEQDPNGYTIMTNGNGFTDTPDSEIKAGQVQIVVSANGSLYHRIAWGSPAKWGDWQDDSYTSKMKYDNLPSLAIFNNFAVIGDSYSKGYVQKADGTILGETSNKWGQFMASQYGTTFTDLSVSGQNTRKFVEGYLDRLKQTKAETYFIILGINDASPDNNIELGSLDDIKNDSSTNPQTFYGDYARIIDTIKQTSPNSKIVLFTIMADWGLRNKFDPAIKNIGKYYGLPVINVLDDQYFSSPLFSTLQSGGHPTVPGYGILANHLMQLIQKCVVDNPDYFNFMGC